uniref:Magnesium and cobalt transport protein CorA n=1 Tax=Candidozyma auris TaxID=498019 RepID=A0A0L0P342_CANAR
MAKKKSARQRKLRLKQQGREKLREEHLVSQPNSRPVSPTGNQAHRNSYMDHHPRTNSMSSARERRMSEYDQSPPFNKDFAPLTDRNLQTLLEQNNAQHSSHRFGLVALDMDKFAREQDVSPYDAIDAFSNHSPNSGGLLEFGELNPPSEHSSDSTSLDDVCYLDYYDDEQGRTGQMHKWPDLEVLEEFIHEELEELQDEPSELNEVNFRYPVARRVSHTPEVADEDDAPLLNRVQVNEVDTWGESSLFKAARKPLKPWEASQLNIHTILNNGKKKSDTLCRFTYFREDLDQTLHSPTLAGLVADSEKADLSDENYIRNSLKELFDPHFQSIHHRLPRATTPGPDTHHDGINGKDQQGKEPHHSRQGSVPPNVSRSSAAAQNLKGSTPQAAASHSSLAHFSGGTTSVNSLSTSPHLHHDPFWLDIQDPLEEEMKVIAKTFGLHPLTTEDIFMDEAREKVEMFNLYYFLCFTSFDIVYERRKQKEKENEKKINKLMEYNYQPSRFSWEWFQNKLGWKDDTVLGSNAKKSGSSSIKSKSKRIRNGELCPLNMYMIVFKHGVLTFHFSATPHPINVRRRARMLKDHLTVSPDWICYALIDDITDSFAPMIDSIEAEVYLIEDEIMRMHSGDRESADESEDSDLESIADLQDNRPRHSNDVFVRRHRSKSVVETTEPSKLDFLRLKKRDSKGDYFSLKSRRSAISKTTTTTSTDLSRIVAWKRKGDMLRRIGECRKRVMSVMRLLSTKADVIRGYSKRFSESDVVKPVEDNPLISTRSATKHEILMYLGDIQDHIVTMVQSLNHYEKLLARSHSNYLAQINIDMTKVNNDTNDVLGKITVLGTIVLPVNVVTGLWGMNCIVPGQDAPGLTWFYGILFGIFLFSITSYLYAKKVYNL